MLKIQLSNFLIHWPIFAEHPCCKHSKWILDTNLSQMHA